MAKTPMYDPGTSEARSPWLAGLTEACNKLSGILNLHTGTLKDFQLVEVFISANDRCRIYQAPLGNKLWLETPTPVFRKNGIVITPTADNFIIDYLGGSIAFDYNNRLTSNDVVTVDATYIIDESGTLNDIISRIDSISDTASKFKGYFSSLDALEATEPSGVSGDFAIVGGEENTIYIWNATTKSWEGITPDIDLSDYYTITQTDGLLSKKENNIVAHGNTAESDNYYYGGRKTWQKLDNKVLNSPIGEIDTSSPEAIGPDDTIATGLGKLQAQVNNYTHDLFGTGAPGKTTEGKIGQDYTNTSNGNKYHLTSIESGEYNWDRYADCVIPSASGNIPLLGADGQLVDSGKSVDDVGQLAYSRKISISLTNEMWEYLGGSTWGYEVGIDDVNVPNWENRAITVYYGNTPSNIGEVSKLIHKYNINAAQFVSSGGMMKLVFNAYFGRSSATFDYGSIPVSIIIEPINP